MHRSFLVWTMLVAMPSALACNLILGNEIPEFSTSNGDSGGDDASMSSGTSGTSGTRDAQADAERDAEPTLPAAQLVFVNGNPHQGAVLPTVVQLSVRGEDEADWHSSPSASPVDTTRYLESPAVFYVSGRIHVLGGRWPAAQVGLNSVAYPELSVALGSDGQFGTTLLGAAPEFEEGRCAARVSALTRQQVDVLCGATGGPLGSAQSTGRVAAYRRTDDDGPWTTAPWPADVATIGADEVAGVVYSSPTGLVWLAKSPTSNRGLRFNDAGAFVAMSRDGLPELGEACGISFRGVDYVFTAASDGITTYAPDSGGWASLRISPTEKSLTDLTCAVTERGVYVAGRVAGRAGGENVMLRALAVDSTPQSLLGEWERVRAPRFHERGAVLIAIPSSASDVGQ